MSGNLTDSPGGVPRSDLSGTGAYGVSRDYFKMDKWANATDLFVNPADLTGSSSSWPLVTGSDFTNPKLYNALKKFLRDSMGVDTSLYTITPIWTPSCGDEAISFMLIDLDVTQLQSGTTQAHVAMTSDLFAACAATGCTNGVLGATATNSLFPITLVLPEIPPSNYVAVQNPRVSLNGNCQKTVTPLDLLMGFKLTYQECFNFEVKINDSDPTNGGVIDGVSPVGGWSYGVFKNGQLIAQGQLTVDDSSGPVFSPNQKTAWETIDTIVTWSDNVDEILNVPSSWFGNTSGYHLPPTFDGANKYYTGRPYMTDSCELGSYPINTGTFAQNTWIIDKDSSGTSSNRDSFLVHRSWNLQYKVTDYLEIHNVIPQVFSINFAVLLKS